MAPILLGEDSLTYDTTVERLQKQLELQKSALVARYEFDKRARKAGETVSHYAAVLKHQATDCKFNDAMRLERLRDRLVSGIRDKRMMSELLNLKLEELTFDITVAKCIAIEQSYKDETQAAQTPVNYADSDEGDSDDYLGSLEVNNVSSKDHVIWGGQDGTGSAVSVLPYKQHKEHFCHVKLAKSVVTLKTYTGQKITPKGEMKCNVSLGARKRSQLCKLMRHRGQHCLGVTDSPKFN
ncbi:unnamed protein product [Porites lobata]|uniref:Uncharacterized protein n=1 Tax=Porites lobata TaxID=104759 RepID=A0ABN8QJG5_9CNID|nr:unnamed protein product [Porites lobata]